MEGTGTPMEGNRSVVSRAPKCQGKSGVRVKSGVRKRQATGARVTAFR